MKILIQNATLISMSEEREKIEENIDILIENNKIAKIGRNLVENNIDKIIDATGKVVMPGLINTHSHASMSIFRETADGYSLQDWLTKKIWPMEDKMTREDIYEAALLSFIESIKTGTTTVNEMYFMTEGIIKAAKETKIRLQTSRVVMDVDGAGLKRFNELKQLLNEYKDKDELITFNIAIHGLYTCSKEYVKNCIEYAKEKELPIHMHFCENEKEVEDIKNSYNELPTEVLKDLFKDEKLILAHCVKLTSEDIQKMKGLDLSVSHCPISNLKLGCGIANIKGFIENGINLSLGTDGQGSSCNLDMFEVMKFTALLQKGINEDACLFPAYEILKMATINGAKALSLEDKIGSIEVGKCADLIVIDTDSVVMNPINDLISDIVYNAKGTDVVTTIVNGKILMEDRKTKFNEKEIFEKCKSIIERIK